jgi:hypothetical protein
MNTDPTPFAVIGRALLRVHLRLHGCRVLSQLVNSGYITKSLLYAPGTGTWLAAILSPASLSALSFLLSHLRVNVASKSLVYSTAVRRL